MTTADQSQPTFGTEPPRAGVTIEPQEVAVLYPCLEPVPHDPHRRRGVDGATLWLYTCDGHGGVVQRPGVEAEAYDVVVAERDELERLLEEAVAENVGLRLRVGQLTAAHAAAERLRALAGGAHSRACGIHLHEHGSSCAPDCPTCNGPLHPTRAHTAPPVGT